jgi:multidrug efflux pump subunit AcrA (membrane-fusion protein)
VQAWIPVGSLPYLQVGNLLKVVADSETTHGEVSAIVPVGDDRSRLFELRITLKESLWKPGKTLRVMVPSANEKEVIAVHRDALVLRRDGIYVFRINKDNIAERVLVQTGIASGPLIEVIGNILPNDQIVTRGGERLRSGQPVTQSVMTQSVKTKSAKATPTEK